MIASKLRALYGYMLASFFLVCAAGVAHSQNAPALSDFHYLGDVSGMQAFEVAGEDGIWMMSPDGKTIVNGMFYDLSGDKLKVNFKEAPRDQMPALLGDNAQVMDVPDAAAAPEPASDFVAATVAKAQGALSGVKDAKKRDLLVDLVARMDRAKSPEEFQLLLLEWQADIEGNESAAQAAREGLSKLREPVLPAEPTATPQPAQTDLSMADKTVEQLARAIPRTIMPTTPNPLLSERPEAPAETATADEGSDNEYLLNAMRHEGFWFGVGQQGAPVVYVFIDPMCPYCARSIRNLLPEIKDGSLQLRVLLAPAISKSSPAKIASILLSDDPIDSFLSHELAYAERGASDLQDRDFADLPASMHEGVRTNYDLIHKNGLPGVPFFAYETKDGIRFLSGVPQPGHFGKALPDSFGGTTTNRNN